MNRIERKRRRIHFVFIFTWYVCAVVKCIDEKRKKNIDRDFVGSSVPTEFLCELEIFTREFRFVLVGMGTNILPFV